MAVASSAAELVIIPTGAGTTSPRQRAITPAPGRDAQRRHDITAPARYPINDPTPPRPPLPVNPLHGSFPIPPCLRAGAPVGPRSGTRQAPTLRLGARSIPRRRLAAKLECPSNPRDPHAIEVRMSTRTLA